MAKSSQVKPKYDFSGIDITAIDPDRLPFGTNQQDCSLIAQTFERGAHHTPTEAAIFATLSRGIQNNKNLCSMASQTLKTYLKAPQDAAGTTASQASQFASGSVPDVGGGTGTSAPTDHIFQALNVGTQQQSANTNSFGSKLMDYARDCIPCDGRLMSFLELHPNIDFLGSMEGYLTGVLNQLNGVADLLNNFDIYGDFCELLNLLSFMCIPDLQRIITLFMALFTQQAPKLDGLIGMLQALIAPLFSPVLLSFTSLLDQFTLLITNPLDCVIDAINAQLSKLNIEKQSAAFNISSLTPDQIQGLSSGIEQLNYQIQDGVQTIRNKLNFYVSQVKAMLDEMGGNDSAYLQAKLKSLQLIRMISFVSSIILALSKGHAACSSSKTPEKQELDNFFDNFLNPNSPFNMWVDDKGQIHIDEKIKGFDTVASPPHLNETLPEFGNVLQFEGETLLDYSVATQIQEVATQISEPIRTSIPCRLEVSASDVNKVNEWISELNKT